MDKDNRVMPDHKVCKRNVAVPTILVEPFKPGGENQVFVQWFGEANGIDLGERQFRFDVPISVDSVHWMGHPEIFKIIMLGQVKDWPKKEAVQEIAQGVTKGDLDAYILWVVSTHFQIENDSGPGPSTFVVWMNIMLGDPNCGIIRPRGYCDTLVLDRENKKSEASNKRSSCFKTHWGLPKYGLAF